MNYLIAGLGNPGPKYKLTRHNCGFLAIDLLSKSLNIPVTEKFKESLIGERFIDNDQIVLMKPLTFMNLSGSVIQKAMAKFRILPVNMVIIYDDKDLPLGKIRIRKKGTSGGHKGLQSVLDYIQNENFIRIRIGIGQESGKAIPTEEFVLSKFQDDEINILEKSLNEIPGIVDAIIKENIEKAMNDHN